MKKLICSFLLIFNLAFAHPEDFRIKSAAADSQKQVALSMTMWGVGMAVGIGVLCYFMKSSTKEPD